MSLAAPAPEPAPAPAPAPAPNPSGILAYAAPPVAVFHSAPLIHAPLVAHVPAAVSSHYTAVYHGAKAVPVHEAHVAAVPLAHPGLVISPYAVHAW